MFISINFAEDAMYSWWYFYTTTIIIIIVIIILLTFLYCLCALGLCVCGHSCNHASIFARDRVEHKVSEPVRMKQWSFLLLIWWYLLRISWFFLILSKQTAGRHLRLILPPIPSVSLPLYEQLNFTYAYILISKVHPRRSHEGAEGE